jgi:hypothetical protein
MTTPQVFYFTADQPKKIRDVNWPVTEGTMGSQKQAIHPDDKEMFEEAKKNGTFTTARFVKYQWVDKATGLVGPGLKYQKPQYIPMSEFLEFNKQRKIAEKAAQMDKLKSDAILASGFGESAKIGSIHIDDDNKYVIQVIAPAPAN